ncbi:LysR substrate-binding domain-containing protein [Cognatishimia sp. 1_MG-2023]|uniref:LysR substrate-binding domain-containing protein n=1 Tax=Cognatishimia sp. 1_MG-2023 TaxID=3062642 RepID=UPI0026E229FD|nr:LysR substrate-binding domain-containing protein [Cognatishimia sp. 1_MG-2023]MDO6728246.1 LysR substrate-binding domain-containing protein [Cognatishimia sp. 1_MG-2023]
MVRSWVQDKDIKLFRVFFELTRAGGFQQAQVSLNISQSSLSTSISQLETRVGMRLCNRGHAGFSLTEDGESLFSEISILFAAMEKFSTNLASKKAEISGQLSIGILENSVTHPDQRLIRALSELQELAPGVGLSVYTAGALELEIRVLDGRLDGAVGLFPHRIDSLEYLPLFEEEHRLYCSVKHPLADGSVSIEDLKKHPYVGREYVDLIEGLEPPEGFDVGATARHMEGLILLLRTQKYFGYLPDHTARPWIERGLLTEINAPGTIRTGKFLLALRREKHRSRPLSALVNLLSLYRNAE